MKLTLFKQELFKENTRIPLCNAKQTAACHSFQHAFLHFFEGGGGGGGTFCIRTFCIRTITFICFLFLFFFISVLE